MKIIWLSNWKQKYSYTHLTWRDNLVVWYSPNAPSQLVLSTVSFPVNLSTVWEQEESWWAGADNMLWLGNGPNVPCSAYPASQMDDELVMGGDAWVGMGFLSPGTKRGGKTLGYCLVHEGRREALMEMRFVQRLKERFFNRAENPPCFSNVSKNMPLWRAFCLGILTLRMSCSYFHILIELSQITNSWNDPFKSENYSPIRPTINRLPQSPSGKQICVIAHAQSQNIQQVQEFFLSFGPGGMAPVTCSL